MGYGSISGRARTSLSAPRAHAICDRCGCRYNFVDLTWQYDYAGPGLINKRLLVCRPCLDRPQEQLKSIVVAADPLPIINARIEYFSQYETDQRVTTTPMLYANISGISGNGTTVTVQFVGAQTYPIGYTINVYGVIPNTYNGTYAVTGSGAGYVQFASAVSAAYSGTGGILSAGYDPVTRIPMPTGAVRITQAGNTRVTQETGEPPYGLNQLPGTDPTVPNAAGGNNPGVPYNFAASPPETNTDIPETGPLK